MKKKVLALVLVLLVGVAGVAGATGNKITQTTPTGQTTVNYDVVAKYTVTIPALTISMTTQDYCESTVAVSAGGNIEYGQVLSVAATSANADASNKFQLVLKDQATPASVLDTVEYTVKKGTHDSPAEAVLSGGAVLSIDAATLHTSGTVQELLFQVDPTLPKYVATYTDTITFTVTVG